jgi:hypothetical protein
MWFTFGLAGFVFTHRLCKSGKPSTSFAPRHAHVNSLYAAVSALLAGGCCDIHLPKAS